jgi:hypothetical protein
MDSPFCDSPVLDVTRVIADPVVVPALVADVLIQRRPTNPRIRGPLPRLRTAAASTMGT